MRSGARAYSRYDSGRITDFRQPLSSSPLVTSVAFGEGSLKNGFTR